MIYGKLWCVVKPTLGIPLIITAVAFGSFNVHLALMNNTTWVKSFLNGNAAKVVSMNTEAPPAAPKAQ